jgi:hypothetical protein
MKVILTEGQVERLKSVLKEGMDNRYNTEISIEFDYYKAKYKGLPIDYIQPVKIRVSYDIEIEARSWGIKGIEINGVRGPESVEVLIQYYGNNDEEFEDWYVLHLDWANLIEITERGDTIVVGDIMEVSLGNDAEGRLLVTKMELPIHKL